MTLYGFPFPVSKNPLGYYFSQEGNANIKADLIQLIMTNPGDRVMLPLYGTNLRKYLFEQSGVGLNNQIRDEIISAIDTWEPRITVTEITVETLMERDPNSDTIVTNEQGVLVKIQFVNPEQINDVQNLVLAIPLGGV